MLDRTQKGTWEGKRSGRWEKGNKRQKGKVSIYLDGRVSY